MSPTRNRGLLLAASVVAFFAAAAMAENQVRIVRLSYERGAVKVQSPDSTEFQPAIPNVPIVEKMVLETGGDGVAEIEFEDASTVRLTPESTLVVEQLAAREEGGFLTTLRLERGTAYVKYTKHKERADQFILRLPERDLTFEHSVELRAEVAEEQADVSVFRGELDLAENNGERKVKKHETVRLALDEETEPEIVANIEPAPFDPWNHERDKYRNQYASALETSKGFPRYGLADLGYYGDIFTVPGYGLLWRPYDAAYPGWSPFGAGYWGYYPSFGWTFISNAPWGWMPYHYGNWQFLPTYGWCWSPSNSTRWQHLPGVIRPPSGFRMPTPPATPPGQRSWVAIKNWPHPRMGEGSSAQPTAALPTPALLPSHNDNTRQRTIRELRQSMNTDAAREMRKNMIQHDVYRRPHAFYPGVEHPAGAWTPPNSAWRGSHSMPQAAAPASQPSAAPSRSFSHAGGEGGHMGHGGGAHSGRVR